MEAAREPHEVFRLWALAVTRHGAKLAAESDAALAELMEKYPDDSAYQIAEAHAARGEPDAAFEWLQRAYAQRDGGLAESRSSVCFRALHADPQWRAFLALMGLAD